MFIVYLIKLDKNAYNFHTDKYYIGQHKTDKINDKYMGSGSILRKLYRKYGKEHAEKTILGIVETQELCNCLEIHFISMFKELYGEQVINIRPGGNTEKYIQQDTDACRERALLAWKNLPEEAKIRRAQRISKKLLGNINGHFRKNTKHSEETKKLISEKVKLSNERRIPILREKSSKVIYFYKDGKYSELLGIRQNWKQFGFSSESVAQRFCRYCTKLLQENRLEEFNFKFNCFLSYVPFETYKIMELFKSGVQN